MTEPWFGRLLVLAIGLSSGPGRALTLVDDATLATARGGNVVAGKRCEASNNRCTAPGEGTCEARITVTVCQRVWFETEFGHVKDQPVPGAELYAVQHVGVGAPEGCPCEAYFGHAEDGQFVPPGQEGNWLAWKCSQVSAYLRVAENGVYNYRMCVTPENPQPEDQCQMTDLAQPGAYLRCAAFMFYLDQERCQKGLAGDGTVQRIVRVCQIEP